MRQTPQMLHGRYATDDVRRATEDKFSKHIHMQDLHNLKQKLRREKRDVRTESGILVIRQASMPTRQRKLNQNERYNDIKPTFDLLLGLLTDTKRTSQ
jgi:hypothetical protein